MSRFIQIMLNGTVSQDLNFREYFKHSNNKQTIVITFVLNVENLFDNLN